MRPVRDNALQVMGLLPAGGRGAEVGTHDGRWTRALVEVARPAALTLIDPWAEDAERDSRAFAHVAPQAQRDAQHDAVRAAFPQAAILRRRSTDALAAMPDGTLDWLFLDGDKHYDVLLADLEQAARVVRPGGTVAGGGWHWGTELGRPVRAAVTGIAARLGGVELHRAGQFWALRLPDAVHLAPRPAGERFLVITTMKNESPYILEWIAHHKAVGFTDFLVFTNDCEDATVPLLDRLQALGVLTHQPNTVLRRGPHKSALKWARDHVLRHEADWMLISDVDEFVNVRAGDGTVQGLLRVLGPETDAVSLPWKIFGNGGVDRFADAPVTAQFTSCEPGSRRGGRAVRDVKTLFRRPEAMYHFGLHRPRVKEDWQDRLVWKSPSGEDIGARMNPGQAWTMRWGESQGAAYLNHYPLRSREAFLLKKNRGRANHVGEDLGLDYWDRWNMAGGTDRSLQGGVPGFAEALAALRSDRTVRRLHGQGVAWHRAQVDALLAEPRYRALWQALENRPAARPDALPDATSDADAA